jgi:hypothetical protein
VLAVHVTRPVEDQPMTYLHHREATPLPDGNIEFWLPTQGGGEVRLTMTHAQAEQCASDLISAVIDADQVQQPER